jgi:hypothetical protein
VQGDKGPGGFAQAPLGSVADDGPADLAGGGEADADEGLAVLPVAGLDHDSAARGRARLGRAQEVRAALQAFDGKRLGR